MAWLPTALAQPHPHPCVPRNKHCYCMCGNFPTGICDRIRQWRWAEPHCCNRPQPNRLPTLCVFPSLVCHALCCNPDFLAPAQTGFIAQDRPLPSQPSQPQQPYVCNLVSAGPQTPDPLLPSPTGGTADNPSLLQHYP